MTSADIAIQDVFTIRSGSLSVPRGVTWTTSVNATKRSFARAPIEAERPVSTCPSSVRITNARRGPAARLTTSRDDGLCPRKSNANWMLGGSITSDGAGRPLRSALSSWGMGSSARGCTREVWSVLARRP